VRLSEKTIELTFCSQLAPLLGRPAWWYGLTQRQERAWGFDVAGRVRGTWLLFQLKASDELTALGERRFHGPHDQLIDLQQRARRRAGKVFYVFPTLGTTAEAAQSGHFLLPHLRFLDVHGLGTIPAPTKRDGTPRKDGTHYLDLSPSTQYVTIRSDPIDVPVLDLGGFLGLLNETRGRDTFETSEHEELLQGFFRWSGRIGLFIPE
jgi:hypothetical protein